MNKVKSDMEASAILIAGKALDAYQNGEIAKAKFLAEQAALARVIALKLKTK